MNPWTLTTTLSLWLLRVQYWTTFTLEPVRDTCDANVAEILPKEQVLFQFETRRRNGKHVINTTWVASYRPYTHQYMLNDQRYLSLDDLLQAAHHV